MMMPTTTTTTPRFRLPEHVRPTHYDLTIWSDLDALQFQGSIRATLDVLQDTDTIQFQAGENLHLGMVHIEAGTTTYQLRPHVDKARERVRVDLPHLITRGTPVTLTAGFAAPIDHTMRGYYASSWAHEGEHGTYAVTQFSPASGRRAFAGWDEPEFKATYTFRMIHKNGTMALGNMPIKHSQPATHDDVRDALHTHRLSMRMPALGDEAWTLSEFATTPLVSSYLVGWANGHFLHKEDAYTSPITGRSVPLRIYATPEYINTTGHGLAVMKKELPLYESLFDIAYPLPKLDGLVVADFDVNAMENWGLITSRTSVFAYDQRSELAGLKRATGTIGHELGHMWFGNMVTMMWWDNLWLKEAFATFMGEVLVMNRVFPAWDSVSDFVVAHLHRALELDAKRSSHPIETPLNTERVENALTQTFDAIPYSKGASVLRMLAAMLGEDVFLRGVSAYLKAHLYGNTVTQDLWESLSEASGKPIATIMAAWTLQQGFPVLTVIPTRRGCIVRQHRFLETGDATEQDDQTLWHVPLAVKVVQDGQTYVYHDMMLAGEREKEIELPAKALWKLNADAIGVYRVAYPMAHVDAMLAANTSWSVADRVGMLSDAFALAQAGYTSTPDALTLMDRMRDDESPLVLQVLAQSASKLASVWWEQPAEVQDALRQWRRKLFGPLARQYTMDSQPHESTSTRDMRSTVMAAAAEAGDPWTLREIARRFEPLQTKGDDRQIPPDLLRTVLQASVQHGGAEAYETVWQMYQAPATPAHKVAAMAALGAAQTPALIERTLAYVFSEDIKTQDIPAFFTALSSNPASRRALWEGTKTHFDQLARRFVRNFSFKNVVRASMGALSSEADIHDIRAFFRTRDTSTFDMSLAQGLESVEAQTAWLTRSGESVRDWLSTHL